MYSSFSRSAGVILLAIAVSGCAGTKWPWQSGGTFSSSSSTPSKSTVSNGATKPSTLATNAPASTMPPAVSYPSYPGATTGMNNNAVASGYPTNTPTGTVGPTYTANANNAASRSGFAAPQQGAYPTNGSISYPANTNYPTNGSYPANNAYPTNSAYPANTPATPGANPSLGAYPTGATGAPYNPSSVPTGGYTPPAGSYNPNMSGSYSPTTTGGYGASNGAASTGTAAPPPVLTINGNQSGTVASTDTSRTAININPNSGTTTTSRPPTTGGTSNGWNNSVDNPVRQTTPPAGDRYSANTSDPFGVIGNNNNANANAYPSSNTPDARYAPAATPRYNDNYSNNGGDAGSSAYPTNLNAPPANGQYYQPSEGSGTSATPYRAGSSNGAASKYANAYQPGSVTSYDPAVRPAAMTANTSSNDPAVGTGYSR